MRIPCRNDGCLKLDGIMDSWIYGFMVDRIGRVASVAQVEYAVTADKGRLDEGT